MRIGRPKKRRSRELICISCPLGCTLTVLDKSGSRLAVTGHRCRKGIAYAEQEMTNPRRQVSTTVRIEGASIDLLPVKTRGPVPKEAVTQVVRAAGRIVARAPVRLGDTVLGDAAGTGVDLVATRSCAALGSERGLA
jgi:CxxC motif-containing protein